MVIEKTSLSAELLGARLVLEGRMLLATDALDRDPNWKPTRSHIESMRDAMKEALEYVQSAEERVKGLG